MLQKIHFVQLSAGPGGIEVLLPKQAKELPGFTIKAFVIREKPTGTNVYDNSVVEVQYGHKRNIRFSSNHQSRLNRHRQNRS
jgi:hypothetical protein